MENRVDMPQIEAEMTKASTEMDGADHKEETLPADQALSPNGIAGLPEVQLVSPESTPGHPVRQAYTVEEVATIIGCHPKTVRKLCAQGKIQSFALGPRIRRIPRSSLEDFIGFRIE